MEIFNSRFTFFILGAFWSSGGFLLYEKIHKKPLTNEECAVALIKKALIGGYISDDTLSEDAIGASTVCSEHDNDLEKSYKFIENIK